MITLQMFQLLTPLLVTIAAILGAVIGSFLNVVVWRLPRGESLSFPPSHCPKCDHKIRPWHNTPVLSWFALRGRCYDCKTPISARYPIVEAMTSVVFAGAVWWLLHTSTPNFGVIPLGVAVLYFAAVGIALSLIDLDTHTLPNKLVLPSYFVIAALLTTTAALTGNWTALLGAGIGMADLFAFYFILAFMYPAGMGFGDVKLAGVVGLLLGWFGIPALIVGAFAAFLLGALFSIVLFAINRKKEKPKGIPFGPWMIVGAWVGILFGGTLGSWYLGLFGIGS
jgi:leader peptidase (prepilin peptidase)/N-methyltransferase